MLKFYNEYKKNNYSFDKKTMLAIFCLVIVIAGFFGFLY